MHQIVKTPNSENCVALDFIPYPTIKEIVIMAKNVKITNDLKKLKLYFYWIIFQSMCTINKQLSQIFYVCKFVNIVCINGIEVL